MASQCRRMLAWAALSVVSAGCTVTDNGLLDQGYFACTDATECGPGQGCAEGNVYAADFCRPACDPADPSSCAGVCTASGACLEACTIGADGSDSGCPAEFNCVRIDALRDIGVCWPVDGCTRSEDCPDESEQCLNEALGLPNMNGVLRFDNLYCTARPDSASRCPEGYLTFEIQSQNAPGGTETLCYPPCDRRSGGTLCPPATTCFSPFGDIFTGTPDTPPCFPGFWGLPCQDDTHCLIGRCLPVGGGHRACTETCEYAEQFGGCSRLEGLGEGVLVLSRTRCESVEGVDTCVPRFDLGSLCDDQLECVAGVECMAARLGSVSTHACLRRCTADAECAVGTGGVASDYRCTPGGICSRRRLNGSRCTEDADCLSGACCPVEGGTISVCANDCAG